LLLLQLAFLERIIKMNWFRISTLFAIIFVLVSCGADDHRKDNSFTVSGTVSGLTGNGLVLQNNGADDKSIKANGYFTFTTAIVSGLKRATSLTAAAPWAAQMLRM
jgi:hypothetical protein